MLTSIDMSMIPTNYFLVGYLYFARIFPLAKNIDDGNTFGAPLPCLHMLSSSQ